MSYWNKLIDTRIIWPKAWLATIPDIFLYHEVKNTIEYDLLKKKFNMQVTVTPGDNYID